jgi:hypothetical protein
LPAEACLPPQRISAQPAIRNLQSAIKALGAVCIAVLNLGAQTNNHSASGFLVNRQAYEFAVGFRPDRFQLLKVGYEWTKLEGELQAHDNVLGVQFVTSLNALSKALK